MITRSADWFSDRGHVRDASFTQLSNTRCDDPAGSSASSRDTYAIEATKAAT
jgi:hypothetical protein